MGYYGDLDEAADAILGGIIKINNIVCINPSYKVKVMDVVSVDMQAYVDIRSERVADIVQEYFSTSDVSHEVKRRILGQAADFVKKHAAVARLRREGFSISRSEERFSRNAETDLVCRLLLEKKKTSD
eukprot:TRINITY_DN14500_c0_g1_i9.p2 TRINITY_DN14500_c0_g1~~TRINITY_DN14500_c0_g1_i9.p2  ORF type:complete len:128 (+),score=15.96 TRINITY_DN14500_c0_g1_i9:546-929(+)